MTLHGVDSGAVPCLPCLVGLAAFRLFEVCAWSTLAAASSTVSFLEQGVRLQRAILESDRTPARPRASRVVLILARFSAETFSKLTGGES